MHLILILFLMNAILFDTSRGSGTVSIRLSNYNNSEGLENDGYCCEDYIHNCHTSNPCDHYFIICLDQLSGSRNDINQCEIGRYSTGTTRDKNYIEFGNYIGDTPNPAEFDFQTWPNSVVIKVEVWDDDPSPNKDDFVDLLNTTVRMAANKSRAEMSYKSFKAKGRTQLDFQMAVFCDENWDGPHCDKHCKPFGNYSCVSEGEEVCPLVSFVTGPACETPTNTSSCTTCDNNEAGSPASQTENAPNAIGITLAVVLVIACVTIAASLIAWKIYQRRHKQQHELLTEDYGLNHNDLAIYYIAEPVQPQHVTEDNIYYNASGDAKTTSDTDTDVYGNSSHGTRPANVYGNANVENA